MSYPLVVDLAAEASGASPGSQVFGQPVPMQQGQARASVGAVRSSASSIHIAAFRRLTLS